VVTGSVAFRILIFAKVWLVQAVAPDVILDLGVDYGYSTFCFALPGLGQV
jgi:hypothetical protein